MAARVRAETWEEELEMVNCPLCDAVIDVDEEDLDEGDPLICEECGANLTVSGVSPLELSSDKEDDDLDDEDDEDDDFEDDDEDEVEEEEEKDEEY
jgi:DNA-directed RNA polymerase subunit M/transcription elongation factor TFIIS